MAEAPETSIDTSSALYTASSAPFTPPDPSDEAIPRLKSPWSQIVRGCPNPPILKAMDPPCSLQPDEHNEKLHPKHLSSELRVSDTAAAVVNTSPISSSSTPHEPLIEASTTSPDRLIDESGHNKLSQQSPAKSPKVVWGKLFSDPDKSSEPEPVMGAFAWPALSEARNLKVSESSKPGAAQKSSPKSLPSFNEHLHLQAPPLLQRETGATHQSLVNKKLTNQVTVNGVNLSNFANKDTPFPGKTMQRADAEQSKWIGGKDPKVVAASEGSPVHLRGTVTSHMSNKESTRNFMWEQGRGNYSFPAYGRGHTSAREQTIPGHQHRGGQRNLPQPYVPFVNTNPGFVYPAGYQNVPGSMYYMPVPTPDPVLAATYFVPPGVQGMFMPGLDILTIQGMVVKQIEYYFSVENLCRDIYLRSKMDEWGFVPVSVIANFNRVRTITPNPYVIIEALRLSHVLEVQGDKVRKKGDWANWLLPSGQPSATSSGDGDQAAKFSTPSGKAEVDYLQSDNSRPVGDDNQSNGHSHLASHIEALSVTALNTQGGNKDPQSHDGGAGSVRDGRLENFQVDDGDSKHFTQWCDFKSGHVVE